MVSGGMSCVKYLLFTFNLLFVISGIVILSVGVLALLTFATYDSFIAANVAVGPILLIIVGVIVFVVAFFGCCGALKENHCMVVTFSVLLLIIFAMEVGGGIAGYVLKDTIESDIHVQLNRTLPRYDSTDIKKSWDILQFDLHCCGIDGPKDWVNAGLKIPSSCCPTSDVSQECPIGKANTQGCMNRLEEFLNHHSFVLGSVVLSIAFVQLIGVLLSCCLAKSIRREYETV